MDVLAMDLLPALARQLPHRSRVALTIGATLAATSGLAVGCGGTASPDGTATCASGVSTADTPVSPPPVTRARATAFAHAVNLTAADVPEATASHKKHRPEHERAHCGGVAHDLTVVNVDSPKLTRGKDLEQEVISSNVTVEPSRRIAVRDLASAQSASGRACYERFLRRHFAERTVKGGRLGDLRITALPVQAAGSDTSVGLRIALMFTPAHGETSLPFYFDLLAFVTGPAEVNLIAFSLAQPEPTATEAQLVSLLAGRAQAHVHAL